MNNSTEIIDKFDFCDGQIESVSLNGESAILNFCNWKEEKYAFIFKNVVYLKCYEFGCDITGVRILNQSQEINEAVEIIKESGGRSHLSFDWALKFAFKIHP